MRILSSLTSITAFAAMASTALGASGPRFYGDPPDEHHPWAIHDGNRPQPKVVTPGTFSSVEQAGKPPSDAVILFDGTDLSKWESGDGTPAKWAVKEGFMEVVPSGGEIRTKEQFGDCQLHIEWAAPREVKGDSQGRGNSGVFLMGRVEIQVLDSYNNVTYADGHAASVYGVNPPMANALRPPGEFQVYDIIFRRPIFKDGKEVDPGYVTVFVNGVVAQDHARLEGPTGHMGRTKPQPFPEKGPLSLQDHGNPTRFRNIWYRPLPPRPIEGGTDGYLTAEAATAKKKEIAAGIRQDAGKMDNNGNPLPQLLRYMESLVYETDDAVIQKVEALGGQYVQSIKALSADKLAGKKDEVKQISGNFKYMTRFKLLPASFGPAEELTRIIKEQGWDKEKKR
jgi:prepilin-type processing-associated H-X9-DG protein